MERENENDGYENSSTKNEKKILAIIERSLRPKMMMMMTKAIGFIWPKKKMKFSLENQVDREGEED